MKTLHLTLLVLMTSFLVNAQDTDTTKTPWKFSSDNSFLWMKGNVDKIDFRTGNSLSRENKEYELSFDYFMQYGELSGVKNNLQHIGGVSFDYKPHNIVSPFVAANILSNRFKGFDSRTTFLIGGKWTYLETDELDFSFSGALLYDFTTYSPSPDAEEMTRPQQDFKRLSLRPKFKVKLKKFTFKSTTFYQPNINDFNDYIINSISSMGIPLTENLDFSVSYIYFFNNSPAYTKIEKEDQKLLFGLKLEI